MISIIIRAKNELPWLKYCLLMLKLQTRKDYELICVDSGSTDGSWELLQAASPDTIYQIAPEAYIPGKVLNQAITHARGEYVVFNNADCIPKDKYWLENLIRPLETDPELVAVYAQQIPRANAIPLVEKDYKRAFGDGRVSARWRHFFSLASSAVKRDIITQYPFKEDIQYSEDIEWSWRMKQLGFKILYVPESKVEHSHNYNLAQIKKRYLGEGKAEAYIYQDYYRENPQEQSFWKSVILAFGIESLRDWNYLLHHMQLNWMLLAPVYRFAQRYYAFKGRNQ